MESHQKEHSDKDVQISQLNIGNGKENNFKLEGIINAKGFMQKWGKQYDVSSISAPVTNDTFARIS